MKPYYVPILTTAMLAMFTACQPEEEAPYEEPTANAGIDQTIVLGNNVDLDGTGSTVCCELDLAYTWSFQQVPIESTLDDAVFEANGTAAAVYQSLKTVDVVGTYVIGLTVTDGVTNSPQDIIVVEVYDDNLPPVAEAGNDVAGQMGNLVCLDGRGSYDPEGAALEYEWSLASAPAGSRVDTSDLFKADSAEPCLVPDVPGNYIMALVVTDGHSYSDPDYATVHASDEELAPYADAGESEVLSPCTDRLIALDGFGSYDPEGADLSYWWELQSAPAGSTAGNNDFDSQTKPDPKFEWDVTGTYTFSLQVFDGKFYSALDVVSKTIVPETANGNPIANAGQDQSVELDADCTSRDYDWTCEMCEGVAFEVDGSGSTDPDGDALSYAWTEPTGTLKIDNPYGAWSRVWSQPVAATYNVDTNFNFDMTLEVADCSLSDTDTVRLTVTCTGEKP